MSVEELESVKRQAQQLKPEEKSELAHYLLGQENGQERTQSALRSDMGKTIRQGNRLVAFALVTLFLWIVTLSIILYAKRPSYLEFPSVNIGQDQSVIDQQLTLMQAEIKVMRDYNDDFLSTIHWSLYTVLIVASLLIGANCVFRTKAATDSRGNRPPIPEQSGHRFRRETGHFLAVGRNGWPVCRNRWPVWAE
jgi:hypothetical protein